MINQAGIQGQLLYATDKFQLRFWRIPSGRHPLGASPDQSEYILVRGNLTLQTPANEGCVIEPGMPMAMQNQPGVWENTGSGDVELLELRWLSPASRREAMPLGEVTEERPWGSFTVLKDEPHFKLKQLLVKPGNRLSLQRHQHREEHWLITQGEPEITVNDTISRFKAQQYVQIPRHAWHRVSNPGSEPVEIIELQLGTSFSEEDIERREDDYGRC